MKKNSIKGVLMFVCVLFSVNCLLMKAEARTQLSEMYLLDDYNYKRMRLSSNDPTGGNFDGLQKNPIKPKETRVIADIKGAGCIQHIWCTIASDDKYHLRNIVLRMYWDGEEYPSVETPIGDFFGLGHAEYYHYSSMPMSCGIKNAMNCF